MGTNNRSADEDVVEVVGNLIIFIVCTPVLIFFHQNIFSSLILLGVGGVVGFLFSMRSFEQWPLFVANKAIKDAKNLIIKHRFLKLVYLIITWLALAVIHKYFKIGFEIFVGVLEVVVGCAMGYFLWLLRLYSEFKKG